MSIHTPPALRADNPVYARDASSASISHSLRDAEYAELIQGLLAVPAQVAPKYLYDTLGSKLFEALCLLPEYYPTRTEASIVRAHLDDIARVTGRNSTLIDLGAGNCAKAEQLFDALAPTHYVAVDISADFLREAIDRLQAAHPDIAMMALGQDFSQGLTLPATVPAENRLFFYPGSSLGNFAPEDARRFLSGLRQSGGDEASLLLGVDLVKDAGVLNTAYDDHLGITSAFNLNLLRNLNQILGSDFDVRDWRHVAYFNKAASRVEMYLQAQCAVDIHWNGAQRRFERGERIHTENSYKYTRESLSALLLKAGWQPTEFWTDPQKWFAVVHARSDCTAPSPPEAAE